MRASAAATSFSMKARTRSRTASTSEGSVKSMAICRSSAVALDVGAGAADQPLGHRLAARHPVVLRLPLVPAVEELLHDPRHLEEAEDVVVGHAAHVAAAPLRVALDRLGPRHEARRARRHRGEERVLLPQLEPRREQRAEVGERVAHGAHVPVVDGAAARGIVFRGRHVVEPPVVVHERRRRRRRHVVIEPADHLGRGGHVLRPGALPAVRPALHLPCEIPLRLAERLEAGGPGVDGVEVGERVDHHLRELAVRDRVVAARDLRRDRAPHHRAAPALHHEERPADHARVLAVEEGARRGREHLVEDGEHPELPPHVVRARGEVAGRRPAEHVVRAARVVEQVSQVRVPAGELPDVRRTARLREAPGDVGAVLRDGDTYSSRANCEVGKFFGRTIIEMDGKEHTRTRALVSAVFSARAIEALQPVITRLVHERIDTFAGAGRADLVAELTTIFPVQVIAHIVGVPADDYARFMRWSLDLIAFSKDPAKGRAASDHLHDYLLPLVRSRRAEPHDDVITKLVTGTVDGVGLTDDEVISFLRLLLPAGAETTSRLMGSMFFALLAERTERLGRVSADRSLVPWAVEETLRWETPVLFVARQATRPAEVAGVAIPEGKMV